MSNQLLALFPGLRTTPFLLTSSADEGYNCIGWAANDASSNWWPVGEAWWPPGVPPAETVEAFAAALGTVGYVPCVDESLEDGVEKAALFTNTFNVPTHAARQLPSGLWTSKIGRLEDIEHEVRALEGELYGSVAVFLKRPRIEAGS